MSGKGAAGLGGGARCMRCEAKTKAGEQCKARGDRVCEGVRYCHLHDPEGTFRKQHGGGYPGWLSRQARRKAECRAKRPARDYRGRQQILLGIGYRTYREYLASDLWKSIRSRILKMARYRCERCGLRATQVHHIGYSYNNLSGRKSKGLVPVCAGCHRLYELDGDRKVTLREAKKRRKAMIHDH